MVKMLTKRSENPWFFFLATYLWSWSVWAIAYFMGVCGESGGIIGPSLILLGLASPMFTGIAFLYLGKNKNKQRDYWARVVNPRLISGKWFLAIFGLMPLLTLVSGLLSGHLKTYELSTLLSSINLTMLVTLIVPVVEELGWRGYVLDLLQERFNALTASIILGALWGFWHLPTFFLNGVLGSVGIFSLPFWLYMINIVLLTVLYTWIYNNNNGSILSAILFHIVLEVLANLGIWPWHNEKGIYNTILLAIIAVTIISKWGYKTLTLKK